MRESQITVWEFADAPDQLRRLLPSPHEGGWLAYIHPGSGMGLEAFVIDRWKSHGLSVSRYELEDGGIILGGRHLPPNGPVVHPAERNDS